MMTTPAPSSPERPLVVLVHGIFDTGGVFHAIERDLAALGFEVFAPSLSPNAAWHGIPDLATKLSAAIDARYGTQRRFQLVGFSMGGIVSRTYLQKLDGADRCDRLVTISSPHHGTMTGFLFFGGGAQQMRAHSTFLQALNDPASTAALADIPLHSYYTPLDLMIVPFTSSHWLLAENEVVWSVAHPLMLVNPSLRAHLRDVLQRPVRAAITTP